MRSQADSMVENRERRASSINSVGAQDENTEGEVDLSSSKSASSLAPSEVPTNKLVNVLRVYSRFAVYCLAINYVLGVGCLGIPLAFQRSGIVFATLVIVVVSLVSYLTVNWVAISVARAEKLALLPCERGSTRWLCLEVHGPLANGSQHEATAKTPLSTSIGNFRSFGSLEAGGRRGTLRCGCKIPSPSNAGGFDLESTGFRHGDSEDDDGEGGDNYGCDEEAVPPEQRKSFEVVELCRKFLGLPGMIFYQVSLCLLMFLGLLGCRFSETGFASISQNKSNLTQVALSFHRRTGVFFSVIPRPRRLH